MLLENKVAVIYGGSGAVGSCMAKVFLREGARVHIAARSRDGLDRTVARRGEIVHASQVDVLDERAVSTHLSRVVEDEGRIDVCVNAVNLLNGEQGIALLNMTADEFERPVREYLRACFNVATAAAARMREQKSGTILTMSAPVAVNVAPYSGSFGMAFAAIEAFVRQFAAEEGPHGVRIVALRPTGMPDSVELGSVMGEMWRKAASRLGMPFEELLEQIGAGTFRSRPISVTEIAEVAAFAVSDRASSITGTVINGSGGAVHD